MYKDVFDTDWWLETGISLSILAGAIILGWGIGWLITKIIYKLVDREDNILAKSLRKHIFNSILMIVVLSAVGLSHSFTHFTGQFEFVLEKMLKITWIATFSWILIKLAYVLEDIVYQKFDIEVADNRDRRKIRTQFQFIKKIVVTIVVIIGMSLILMSFARMRELGTSLLASAGVAGIIIGFAAQRSISNILAGFQIAFTQPIRIDDVVIVENEWGRIEEINLTYIVVRIWDLRRLVLPITYFIERPFQNWTRNTADIIGSVFLYVDYTIDIESVRTELKNILDASELWDKKTQVLQVTNTTDKCIELRALMSAKDASTAWDLRCEVREKLIVFIQKNYPESLPFVRATLSQDKAIADRGML